MGKGRKRGGSVAGGERSGLWLVFVSMNQGRKRMLGIEMVVSRLFVMGNALLGRRACLNQACVRNEGD